MKTPENFTISANNRIIDSSLYKVQTNSINNISKKSPVLIFAHGFKGFKDWGGFPFLCTILANSGFNVLSFNFSHNGVNAKQPLEFTRLDLFAENTHTIELEDLNAVIKYIPNIAVKYNIDINRIGLIGHSRGGGLSIIAAYENPEIKALASLAAVSDFMRYTDYQIKKWKEKGYLEIPNTRTNQMMRLNLTLLEDIEKNSSRLNILNAAKSLQIPFLIIHGKEDLAVNSADAEKIFSAANSKSVSCAKPILKIIENTGHTFGTVHPFNRSNKYFDEVIRILTEFFKNNL